MPVGECVCPGGQGIEVVWAANGHDLCVLGDECFIKSKLAEPSRSTGDVSGGTCLVVPKEADSIGFAQIVVEKANKKGICPFVAEFGWHSREELYSSSQRKSMLWRCMHVLSRWKSREGCCAACGSHKERRNLP